MALTVLGLQLKQDVLYHVCFLRSFGARAFSFTASSLVTGSLPSNPRVALPQELYGAAALGGPPAPDVVTRIFMVVRGLGGEAQREEWVEASHRGGSAKNCTVFSSSVLIQMTSLEP
jgi:hypothetical protein